MDATNYVRVSCYKTGVMALGVLSIQLTYTLFSLQTFIHLNALMFCIGLHTCFTYSSQVGIWEGRRIERRELAASGIFSLLIAFFYSIATDNVFLIFVSFSLLIGCKYFERVSFNWLLTRDQVSRAYLIFAAILILEIFSFSSSSYILDPLWGRFLLPGIVTLCFLSLVYKHLCLMRVFDGGQEEAGKNPAKNSIFMSLHSFFILVTIMMDRIALGQFPMGDEFKVSAYLLLFSYASALYAIGVASLETMRHHLFKVASNSASLSGYFKDAGLLNVFLTINITIVIMGITGAAILLHLTEVWEIASRESSFVWFSLCLFFGGFLGLAFVQVYFIANRIYLPLFLSWIIAFICRSIGVFVGDWKIFISLTIVSGFAAVLTLFILEHR